MRNKKTGESAVPEDGDGIAQQATGEIEIRKSAANDLAAVSRLAGKAFNENLALIRSIVKRLQNLDPTMDYEDFMQQAFIGTHNAVRSYKVITDAKFQTVLVWHIYKIMERLIPPQARQVVVSYPDGTEKLMSYQAFRKIKRGLPEGTSYRTEMRFVSLESMELFDADDDMPALTKRNGKNGRHKDE